jgi:hypothetical protein
LKLKCKISISLKKTQEILVLFLFSIVFVAGVVLLIVCFAFLRWSERSKRKSVSSRSQIEEPAARARECFSASTLYLTV